MPNLANNNFLKKLASKSSSMKIDRSKKSDELKSSNEDSKSVSPPTLSTAYRYKEKDFNDIVIPDFTKSISLVEKH